MKPAEETRNGLILATGSQATDAIEALVACCDWPVLWQATPAVMRRTGSLDALTQAICWIEHEHELESASRLLEFLASFHPGVRRGAVGYRLPAQAEIALRSAGAQLYLAVDGLGDEWAEQLSAWLAHDGVSSARAPTPRAYRVRGRTPSSGPILNRSGPP